MEAPRSADTIDLSKSFLNLVRLLIDNIRVILTTSLLCMVLGGIYFWVVPRSYQSKMIIQSDILSESYCFKLAENLEGHIQNKDFDFLASKLNLTVEEAQQLGEFKIVSALTPMSQQMAEKDKIIVVISVRVQSNALLPKLQAGVIHYFSDNEYIRKRVEENRKKYEGLITALDREIKMIDTLKNKIRNGTFASAKVGGVAIMDVAGLYGVTASLYDKKFETAVDLAMVDSIQVIEDFTPYGKPIWPKLSIIMITSLIFAAVIIFLIISYRSLNSQFSKKTS
jgi:hypothetical protein